MDTFFILKSKLFPFVTFSTLQLIYKPKTLFYVIFNLFAYKQNQKSK